MAGANYVRFDGVPARDLDPDIDVTARAIARVVGALTGDFVEQATIIGIAAFKAKDMLVAQDGSAQ